ncbi:MAG TPA: ABC transporter permease [Methylomirabilota bacterium]|nr:ABC transporter permease [Methylomirabilota bacterium]
MNGGEKAGLRLWLLNNTSLVLFLIVVVAFSILAPAFRQPQNAFNILLQSSSTGILAVGMTFVLLTAGVDLSVGAVMFVAGAVAGKLALGGMGVGALMGTMLAVGAAYGAMNALFITRLGIVAFVVTLATNYFGRGLGFNITKVRSLNLPEGFYELGAARLLGIPAPVLIFAGVAVVAHLTLTRTPFGRQLHALGADINAARKAGINTRGILFVTYVICAVCAAIAAIVALSQAPSVDPTFGRNREFLAIAAAVLGGASLFGGRGSVLPGTVLGAVLIQTIENGLNILNVNPYAYPIITGSIIFVAILTDAIRTGLLAKLTRRKIFVEG